LVSRNTEETIERLLHLLEVEPDFPARLRKNFDIAVQVVGVPISLDATRGFLKGSPTYSVEDLTKLPEGENFASPRFTWDFDCTNPTITTIRTSLDPTVPTCDQ
jgi:hypothetical protein